MDKIEQITAKLILEGEYEVARRNQERSLREFESSLDMLECERTDKDYDWMSDIFLPEFTSHVLTDSAISASQYFTTRDFVECYLEDEGEQSQKKAASAKECINRTLNQKHLYFFQKFMRAKLINGLGGYVYARCWWEQEIEPILRYRKVVQERGDIDEYGNPLVDTSVQVPARMVVEEEYEDELITMDRFNFDILDPRNVFTDNTYCYSVQQKKWLIIRFEKTLRELKSDAKLMGYINLDKLENIRPPDETDTSKETFNKEDQYEQTISHKEKPFDIIERYGDWWVIVKPNGELLDGIDEEGKPLKKAELLSCIITYAKSGSTSARIRFQLNPFYDATGKTFLPVIRGLCYIHPTKDSGLGDGKFTKELQVAINDTFNISNDRVKLATMPTLKYRKYADDDLSQLYFEPGHPIPVENPDDLVEFKISDNIVGALQQISMLTGKMQQVDAIYPTTMGGTPDVASTTATAIAGAESRTNTRTNYKSLTFEHTFLTELYWMILQMTWGLAKPDTGEKLMGSKVYDFDPNADYVYKPLSQAIETEYSKAAKTKLYTTLISYIAQVPNPNTYKLINLLIAKIFDLAGDEVVNYQKYLLDESVQPPVQGGMEQTGGQMGMPMSNQNSMPMSATEQGARGMM